MTSISQSCQPSIEGRRTRRGSAVSAALWTALQGDGTGGRVTAARRVERRALRGTRPCRAKEKHKFTRAGGIAEPRTVGG